MNFIDILLLNGCAVCLRKAQLKRKCRMLTAKYTSGMALTQLTIRLIELTLVKEVNSINTPFCANHKQV